MNFSPLFSPGRSQLTNVDIVVRKSIFLASIADLEVRYNPNFRMLQIVLQIIN